MGEARTCCTRRGLQAGAQQTAHGRCRACAARALARERAREHVAAGRRTVSNCAGGHHRAFHSSEGRKRTPPQRVVVVPRAAAAAALSRLASSACGQHCSTRPCLAPAAPLHFSRGFGEKRREGQNACFCHCNNHYCGKPNNRVKPASCSPSKPCLAI